MATASKNGFKLIGPNGTEVYHSSAVTLSCRLSPEISAVNMEIWWFKETDCVCVYKNRQVTEGRGYEGRVSLELEEGRRHVFFRLHGRENVSLKLKDCKESDLGHYLCQVTDGDRTEEITVAVWPCIPPKEDDQTLYVCQRNREWTEDERMKMKISASQIEYLRDRFEHMKLKKDDQRASSSIKREPEELSLWFPPSPPGLLVPSVPIKREPIKRARRQRVPSVPEQLGPRRRSNSTDGHRPNMSGE